MHNQKSLSEERNLFCDSASVHMGKVSITKYKVNNRSIVLIFLTAPLSYWQVTELFIFGVY